MTRFTATPVARAGRPFIATARIADDEPLERSHVRCAAKAGRRALAARKSVRGTTAACRWIVPRASRGLVLRGSVTVRAGGDTARRAFSRRIR